MNRLLIFHYHETTGNEARMAPSAYYMDGEYDKVSVRIYAEVAPLRDAKIDIFDDGTSIFNNQSLRRWSKSTGVEETNTADTTITLTAGENSEEAAEDFTSSMVDEGSWVYCNLVDSGGGKNFTVQLELHQTSEDEVGDD